MHPLPTAVQLRNNQLLIYKDISYSEHSRNGCKASLKQNLKNVYMQNIKELNKIDEFDDVIEHSKEYEKNINLFNEAYKDSKITLKQIGTLSQNQQRTVKRLVENFVNTIYINGKKRGDLFCTFVTLTLPSKQIHSDKLINKCLSRFLENLQQSNKIKNYIWRAESQSNGNIHYHILCDKSIDKDYIRERWNSQVNKLGYVDRSVSDNPNSTDIHGLSKVKNVVSYIQKYVTKTEKGKRPILSRLWGASKGVKLLSYPKVHMESLSTQEYRQMKTIINHPKLREFDKIDFVQLFTGKLYQIINKTATKLWQLVKNHYANMKKLTWEEAFDLNDKPIPYSERVQEKTKPIQKIIQTSLFNGDLKPI